MLPLYPPYAIADLAHEHLEGRLPDGRPRRRYDPDVFFGESQTLQPDPVFMGLRRFVSGGPIGAVMHWIDQRIEAREDRIPGARVDAVGKASPSTQPTEIRDSGIDDRPDQRTAA